mgnify:CR=1 FL=1
MTYNRFGLHDHSDENYYPEPVEHETVEVSAILDTASNKYFYFCKECGQENTTSWQIHSCCNTDHFITERTLEDGSVEMWDKKNKVWFTKKKKNKP